MANRTLAIVVGILYWSLTLSYSIMSESGDLSVDEIKQLLSHFKTMKVKPKVDTFADFQAWMRGHVLTNEEAQPDDVKPTVYTTGAMQHFPKISPFSGDGKKDVPYDVWRSEVLCIIKEGHPSHAVAQAVRSSLRGEALRVRSRLGPSASTDQVLAKMDSVYGNVQQTEMLLAAFYSARQKTDEDVGSWSCRLEDLLYKAAERGQADLSQSDAMLRTMFWSGLTPCLKDASGHLYERITDFDQLRVAIRRLEEDCRSRQGDDKTQKKREVTPAKSATPVVPAENTELQELRGMIQQLATEVRSIKDNKNVQDYRKSGDQHGHQDRNHHISSRTGNSMYNHRNDRHEQQQRSSHNPAQPASTDRDDSQDHDEEPTCYRCGQVGHIALGCRAKVKPLNSNRPASRGRR